MPPIHAHHPSSSTEIPVDLVDSLGCKSPHDALLALASESDRMAAKLAEELTSCLSSGGNGGGGGNNNIINNNKSSSSSATASSSSKRKSKLLPEGDNADHHARRFPIPLPKSLRDAPRPAATPQSSAEGGENNNDDSAAAPSSDDNGDGDGDGDGANNNHKNNRHPTPSRSLHKSNPSHPLTHATLAAESILSSLSKIASGGSAASSEMRALERHRQAVDAEALDLESALRIREGCTRAGDNLVARRYADAARAVSDVEAVLHGRGEHNGRGEASQRARDLAGPDALAAHDESASMLRRAVGERYEAAVRDGDVGGLSELTPLLGMLDMAELGVKLYLRYSQSCLREAMDAEPTHGVGDDGAPVVPDLSNAPREEGMSRAAMRRRAEERSRAERNASVPAKLARIYNAAVTHLRHHLPMVAYALGEADGDAALVQLVHVEAEGRSVDILRESMAERELGRTVRRAEAVAAKVEDRYAGGGGRDGADGTGGVGGVFGMDEKNIAGVIMGLGGGGDDATARKAAAQRDDCGFTVEVGNLSDVDAALEEWALVMQHTESYERFVRHAAREVIKARRLRREQKREERRRRREAEEARERDDGEGGESALLGGAHPATPRENNAVMDEESDEDAAEEERIEILPAHTALNEVSAEIGGYYSSLERCLLLAGMQRAFVRANFPDDSTFAEVAIGNSGGGGARDPLGRRIAAPLQTNLVEECLFAARRSTMRAFATGHTGTASAAANVCVDVLGRVLLEALTRRAELGASLVRPGEGLLGDSYGDDRSAPGAAAAFSFAKSTAGKVSRGARARAGGGDSGDAGEESPEELRRRAALGVARAAANFNDLEVAADYTKRLEANFLREIDAGYPPDVRETEQLRMCVRGLSGVVESFSQASRRSVEELISVILPRARQIASESVGAREGGGGGAPGASNFLGSPVLTVGGGTAGRANSAALDYNLDDAAFELAQISEGYIGRMCAGLDELIEPLRVHLVPKLADDLVIGILGGVSKRLEAAIRKSKFTPLGAISLDSDIRYLMNFAKDRIDSPELKSNVTLCRACPPLARLNQITLLMNVDDLEDALDLISVSKRKGNWDLKLDDAKILLSLRVDFEGSKVNDLLQIEEE